MRELTVLEQIILAAIINLKENAYGVSIRKKVKTLTGKSLMYGTLYNALNQLLRKRLVTKTKGLPTAERGGRSKIYYKLTKEGEKALREVYRLQKSVWASIPHFLGNDKT